MSIPNQLSAPSSHHADEEHEGFDPEPVQSLPPDEPPSPLWLPALGAGILLGGALLWVLTGDEVGDGLVSPEGRPASTATAAAVPRPAGSARPVARPAGSVRPVARPAPPPADGSARPRPRRIPRPAARPSANLPSR